MQIWVYAAIGLAGLAMACVFKFPAVIVASGAIVALIAVWAASQSWSAISTLVTIVAALFTFHITYLLGLIVSSALAKKRKPNSEKET